MCTYIFAGRFQPFHNGHWKVFEQICEKLLPEDILILAVVAPFESNEIKDKNFLLSTLEHHSPERNPWEVSVPLRAITQVARSSRCANQIMTTLLPRPEYGWSVIVKWFTGKRVWVIPSAGEDFDDKKSNYFETLGDAVIRIKDTSGISGKELRDFLAKRDYDSFANNVPDCVKDIYCEERADRSVGSDFQRRAENFEKNSRWVTDDEINSVPQKFLTSRNYLGHLLDAGGGTGYLSYYLTRRITNYESVTLVDLSREMLEKATERENYLINTSNTSIENYCCITTKKFDTILLRQVLHYVDDVDKAISLLSSVLNNNGFMYVGQILVDDKKCKEWHDELIQNISKNRRRTFLLDEFVELFRSHGFIIVNDGITVFEENLKDLYKRSTYDSISFDDLKNKMKTLVTDNVRKKMNIKEKDDNLCYTVKFCHLLLKKQDTES